MLVPFPLLFLFLISTSASTSLPERLHVLGGSDADGVAITTLHRLESKGRWVPKPSLRTPRFALAVAAYGDFLYATGGYMLDETRLALQTVERYDGAKWSYAPDLGGPRMGHAAVAHSGLLYVLGGNASSLSAGGPMSSVEQFDGTSWSDAEPMILPRTDFGAASFQGLLFAIGGNPESPSSVEYFNGTAWSLAPSTLRRRIAASAAVMGGYLYSVGGFHESSAERFDGTAWSLVPPLSSASPTSSRRFLGLAALGQHLYAAGGSKGDEGPSLLTAGVSRFDGASSSWRSSSALPEKAYGLGLAPFTPPSGNCSLFSSCNTCVPETGCAWTMDHGCAMPDSIKCDLLILSLDGCNRIRDVKKDTFIGVIPAVAIMLTMLVALYRDILSKGGLSAEAAAQPLLHPNAVGSPASVDSASAHHQQTSDSCCGAFQRGMKRARPYIMSIITCYTATNSMFTSKAVDSGRTLEHEAFIPLACTSSGLNIPRSWYLDFLERIPGKLAAGVIGFALLGLASIAWDYIWSRILMAAIAYKYKVAREKDPWWKKALLNTSFLPLQLIKVAVGTFFLPSIATHVLAFAAAPWKLATEGIGQEKALHLFWALLGWNLVPAVVLVLMNASVPFGLYSVYKSTSAQESLVDGDGAHGGEDDEGGSGGRARSSVGVVSYVDGLGLSSSSRSRAQDAFNMYDESPSEEGEEEGEVDHDFPRALRSKHSAGSLREDAATIVKGPTYSSEPTSAIINVHGVALGGSGSGNGNGSARGVRRSYRQRYVDTVLKFIVGSFTNMVFTFLSIPLPVMEPFFPAPRQLLDAAAARGSMALFVPIMVPYAGPYLFLLMAFFNILQPFGVGVWIKDTKDNIYGRLLGAVIFSITPLLLLLPRFQAGSYILKN